MKPSTLLNNGKYKKDKLLGKGAYGKVFKGLKITETKNAVCVIK